MALGAVSEHNSLCTVKRKVYFLFFLKCFEEYALSTLTGNAAVHPEYVPWGSVLYMSGWEDLCFQKSVRLCDFLTWRMTEEYTPKIFYVLLSLPINDALRVGVRLHLHPLTNVPHLHHYGIKCVTICVHIWKFFIAQVVAGGEATFIKTKTNKTKKGKCTGMEQVWK